VIEVEW